MGVCARKAPRLYDDVCKAVCALYEYRGAGNIRDAVAADTRFFGLRRGRVELISEKVSADNAVTYSRIDARPRKSRPTTQRWSRGAALIAPRNRRERERGLFYLFPGANFLKANKI